MTTTETTTAGRRRSITVEGDGQRVTRVARRHDATATVRVSPDASTPADYEHPGLTLTVGGDGRWTLAYELAGWGQVPPIEIAAGHIDTPPAAPGNPAVGRLASLLAQAAEYGAGTYTADDTDPVELLGAIAEEFAAVYGAPADPS